MGHYANKVAIITGGASGIGRAVSEAMGRQGAVVVIADVDIEGAREVVKTVTATGGKARAVSLDVTREKDVRRLINETADEYGRLDFMFNNAGIGVIGDERDKTPEHWQKILDINLNGVVYGTTEAYSLMVRQGFGHIVNTASLAGLIPSPTEVAYGATKHAVVGLSTSLRAEGAALGVKVSVICPGVVRTPIFDSTPVLNIDKEELMEQMPAFIMLDVNKAAASILRGVARNQAIIVFPFHARLAWLLYRISPAITDRIGRFQIKNFRKFRKV